MIKESSHYDCTSSFELIFCSLQTQQYHTPSVFSQWSTGQYISLFFVLCCFVCSETPSCGSTGVIPLWWLVVLFFLSSFLEERKDGHRRARFVFVVRQHSYLVDPASSHMLVSKIKPCMSKYKQLYTVKLRTAHYISNNLFDGLLLHG